MKLVNTSSLPTEELRKRFYDAARWAGVSLRGTLVQVHNGVRSRCYGRCWGCAEYVFRNGKRVDVNGYIKLWVHKGRTIDDVTVTFVHELSHLIDSREYKMKGLKLPYGQERRARALEEKYKAERGKG